MSTTCQALEHLEFFELLELFPQLKVRIERRRKTVDLCLWCNISSLVILVNPKYSNN